MADAPVEPVTPAPKTDGSNAVHSKVAIPVFVGAVGSLVMYLCKTKFGLDLSGQEANITVILMGLTGWLVPT